MKVACRAKNKYTDTRVHGVHFYNYLGIYLPARMNIIIIKYLNVSSHQLMDNFSWKFSVILQSRGGSEKSYECRQIFHLHLRSEIRVKITLPALSMKSSYFWKLASNHCVNAIVRVHVEIFVGSYFGWYHEKMYQKTLVASLSSSLCVRGMNERKFRSYFRFANAIWKKWVAFVHTWVMTSAVV